MKEQKTYLATAYRYGWLNGSSYIVYCGTDHDEAIQEAENENHNTGNKYGIEVREYPGEKRIAYFSSGWCEKEPTVCRKTLLALRFGERVISEMEDKPGERQPEWLAKILAFEKQCVAAMCGE